MKTSAESFIQPTVNSLYDFLMQLESYTKYIAWRITSFPAEQTVNDLEFDFSKLDRLASTVAFYFGQLAATVEIAAELREHQAPTGQAGDMGDHANPGHDPERTGGTAPEAFRWRRGPQQRTAWYYGPYHVIYTPQAKGCWGVFRGDSPLDYATDCLKAKRIVERLHAVESQGVLILGEDGDYFEAIVRGERIESDWTLGPVLEAAEAFLAEKSGASESPGDVIVKRAVETRPESPEWRRGPDEDPERWQYGPYHVARIGEGWGVHRGDMMLGIAADLETTKKHVEFLHFFESEGMMILAEHGAGVRLTLNFDGEEVGSADDLESIIQAAMQYHYDKARGRI